MAAEFNVTANTVARWFRPRSSHTLAMPDRRVSQLLRMACPDEKLIVRERADFSRADARIQIINNHPAVSPRDWHRQNRLHPHVLLVKKIRLSPRRFIFTIVTGYVGSPYVSGHRKHGEVIAEALLPTGYHAQLVRIWLLHERMPWRVIAGGATGEHTTQAWLSGAPLPLLEATSHDIQERAGTGLLPLRLQQLWSGE